MNFRKACLFIDGENLRHSICDLFTADQFHPTEYLPKSAAWQSFFDDLVQRADADIRLRTYWYVVSEIDFWPFDIKKLLRPTEFDNLLKTIQKKINIEMNSKATTTLLNATNGCGSSERNCTRGSNKCSVDSMDGTPFRMALLPKSNQSNFDALAPFVMTFLRKG